MTTSLRCRDDDPDARGERRASIKKSDRPRGPTAEVDARLIRLGRVFAIPIAARQPQLLVSVRQLVVCPRQRDQIRDSSVQRRAFH